VECAIAVKLILATWRDEFSSRFSSGGEWGSPDNFPSRRGF
jgi:hypothetical protein